MPEIFIYKHKLILSGKNNCYLFLCPMNVQNLLWFCQVQFSEKPWILMIKSSNIQWIAWLYV